MVTRQRWITRFLPAALVALFAVYIAASVVSQDASAGGFDFSRFGQVPVLVNGRIRPMDSVARLGLMQITGSVTVPAPRPSGWQFWKQPKRVAASEWLAEVLMKPDAADARPIFPVSDPKLLATLALSAPQRPGRTYLSFRVLHEKADTLRTEATRIGQLKPEERAPWERQAVTLRNSLLAYERLKNSLQPNSQLQQDAKGEPVRYDFVTDLGQYRANLRLTQAALARGRDKATTEDIAAANAARAFAQRFSMVSRASLLSLIPPQDQAPARQHWENVGTVVIDSVKSGKVPIPLGYLAAISSAFAHGDAGDFNNKVSDYLDWLGNNGSRAEVNRAWNEQFTVRLAPLFRAATIYLFAFAVLVVARLRRSPVLLRCGIAVVGVAIALHVWSVLSSMMLDGRPPLGTVYSALVVSALAVVLVAGWFEHRRRTGAALATGVCLSVVTIGVAQALASSGVAPLLRAALDADFLIAAAAATLLLWLGTWTASASAIAGEHVKGTAAAPVAVR